MKKFFWLPLLLLGFAAQAQLIIEDEVVDALREKTHLQGGYLPVVLLFHNQYNFDSLVVVFEARQASKHERVSTVLAEGPAHAERVQQPWVAALEQLASRGIVRNISSLWICNGLFFEILPGKMAELEQLNPPAFLWLNRDMQARNPGNFVEMASPESFNGSEVGLRAIRANFMWNLGYSGLNQRVYVYDSGTRSEHPAIREQFLGNRFALNQGWRSYFGNTIPIDRDQEHGTHVAGTVVGLEKANNDTVGVAPAAYFFSNDIIPSGGNLQNLVNAYQFAINPDGNTATTHDAADVINNSWGFPSNGAACNAINGTFAALEASGIANVYAAGNDGPGVGTVGGYGAVAVDSLRNFAVGNLDANNSSLPINSTSSRGPTICSNVAPLSIKPEVSAPGTNIRSSVNGSGYALYTGTSMASPHVAGALLLLGEAFPTASPRQKLNALYQTCTDLGDPGEDNNYGRGMINLQAAFNFLEQSLTPAAPSSLRRDLAIQGFVGRKDGDRFCVNGNSVNESILVKNVGKDTITEFTVQYGVGNYNSSANWTGSLRPGQSTQVALNINGPFSGVYSEVFARVRAGNTPERDTINNYFSIRMLRQDGSTVFGNRNNGMHQDFANASVLGEQWGINNLNGDLITWEHHTVTGLPGTSSAVKVRMNNYSPAQGQRDELLSPFFTSMGTSGNMDLHFRMAYRSRAGFNADSLLVYLSTDCSDWTLIYSTGGAEMVTYPSGLEPTTAAHWRMVRVPQVIPAFTKMALKFVTRNGFGGNLYLTNISYGDVPLGLHESEAPQFSLYPNPSTGSVTLELAEATAQRQLRITDQAGREVYRQRLAVGESQVQLALTELAAGFYVVHVDGAGGTANQKLILTK